MAACKAGRGREPKILSAFISEQGQERPRLWSVDKERNKHGQHGQDCAVRSTDGGARGERTILGVAAGIPEPALFLWTGDTGLSKICCLPLPLPRSLSSSYVHLPCIRATFLAHKPFLFASTNIVTACHKRLQAIVSDLHVVYHVFHGRTFATCWS